MRQRDHAVGECSLCGKTVRAGAALYLVDGRLVCALCYTKVDIDALLHDSGFDHAGAALVGAVANLLPFLAQAMVVLIGGTFASAVASRIDACALFAGLVAVPCGGSTVAAARTCGRHGWLAIGALVGAVGVYHVVRGVGLVS